MIFQILLIVLLSQIGSVTAGCDGDPFCIIDREINNLIDDVEDIIIDVGTAIPNTLSNIGNDINQVVNDVVEIAVDVGTKIPNDLIGIANDITGVAEDIGGVASHVHQQLMSEFDAIADTFTDWFVDFNDALQGITNDLRNLPDDIENKLAQFRSNFNSLASSFNQELDAGAISLFLKGLLDSNVLPDDWIDLFGDAVAFLGPVVDQLFSSSIPTVVGRRRRLITRSRRKMADCTICPESAAVYTDTPLYIGVLNDLVLFEQGGSGPTDFTERKMVYSSVDRYIDLKMYIKMFSFFKRLCELIDEVVDGCISIKEIKCVYHVLWKGILIGLFEAAIWVLEIFTDATDWHDGTLLTTQVQKIFEDQSVIIQNQNSIYNLIAGGPGSAKSTNLENLLNNDDNIERKITPLNLDDRYLTEGQITLCLISIMMLSLSILIYSISMFIKIYKKLNNPIQHHYEKCVDTDLDDKSIVN
eukprot:379468_1